MPIMLVMAAPRPVTYCSALISSTEIRDGNNWVYTNQSHVVSVCPIPSAGQIDQASIIRHPCVLVSGCGDCGPAPM